jgi:hypothetical protein
MSDSPQREMTLVEQVADHIDKLERQAEYLSVTQRKVPEGEPISIVGPEIGLAMQDLQMALTRMRKVKEIVDPPEPEPEEAAADDPEAKQPGEAQPADATSETEGEDK